VFPLDVWNILIAEQPSSKEWQIDIRSGSCPDIKGDGYDRGILCTFGLDSVLKIVYFLKLVYKFKLVYSFKVVYRCDEA
jgi:hypothetical protein